MDETKLTLSASRLWPVRMVLTIGLALLFLAALLRGVTPTQADSGALYVDGASGHDLPTCGTILSPCKTISYTLNTLAAGGDTIRVAQGTYTENLTVQISVTLQGGYESSGWTRNVDSYETILDGSGSQPVDGDWDGGGLSKPAVISDGTEFKMWFDGANLFGERQVGLAMSPDGISWTKYLTNPVLEGSPGAWDESGEHAPFVLKEGGVYKMWYEGESSGVRQLGYATSTNGVDWFKYGGNPVLVAGPESYDRETAGHGSLISDEGTYKLWYHAMGDGGPIVAYATSADGIGWTKQGPVLEPASGGWDEFGLWGPSVLKLDGTYWMWYAGSGPQGPPAIGVVTSTNGITWTHFLAGPVLTDTNPVGDPHVITDGGRLKMWYHDLQQQIIYYAESDDGIAWTPSLSNPVLSPGTPGQWGDPVVRFESDSDGSVLDGLTITGGQGQEAGGVHAGQTMITIRDCLIRDNFADGSPDSNGGGGVLGSDELTIVDSLIVNNEARQGASGVRVGEGRLIMTNTLVVGGRGAEGMHLNGSARLMNVTISGNGVGTGRPGINFNPQTGGMVVMTNTIIYGNGDSIHVEDPNNVQANYSDIQGGWMGTDNMDVDPMFVDAAAGDYHLSAGSQLIDRGTDAGAPAIDWEGDLRPLDGDLDGTATTDIGADEFNPFRTYLSLILVNVGP